MAESSNKKPSFVHGLKSDVHGLKSEFKKVIWPNKTTLGKQAVAVTIISVILGLVIALLDTVIQYGINFITM